MDDAELEVEDGVGGVVPTIIVLFTVLYVSAAVALKTSASDTFK